MSNKNNTQKTIDAYISGTARIKALLNIIGASIVLIGMILLVIYTLFLSDITPQWPLLLVGGGGILIAGYTLLAGVRVMTKKTSSSAPFEGADTTGTSVKGSFASSKYKGEDVKAWFGPVMRRDREGLTDNYGLHERLGSPENTLFITDKELIGLTLTQADFNDVESQGLGDKFGGLATMSETAEEERNSVVVFNRKKWAPKVDQILSEGKLKSMLSDHHSYGMPISDIECAWARKFIVFRNFYIKLSDGKILKFNYFSDDQTDSFIKVLEGVGIKIGKG